MKEIGGYFEFEQLINNEFHREMIHLNSGRNCIAYIFKARNIGKLFIPYLLCDSVARMCQNENFRYGFYSIDAEFMPIMDGGMSENDYLLIVNYYGQITNEKIVKLAEKYKRIIVDNCQAFFQEPVEGIDTFYSCRKFFGVPDGAYLSTNALFDGKLVADNSKNRMEHLFGRYEGTASDYYDAFKKADNTFEELPIRYMSRITQNILGAVDYERVLTTRGDNYCFLAEQLGKKNRLKLEEPKGPFAYPLYMDNGIKIRRMLAEKRIYIPSYWPNVINEMPLDSKEYDYAANILPLPCDQRYTTNDMQYLIDRINKVFL